MIFRLLTATLLALTCIACAGGGQNRSSGPNADLEPEPFCS